MVAGYHLIWTAYGWWLPTDPRGSSSHEIRVEPLKTLGDLHPGRKALQPSSAEIQRCYVQAAGLLQHPLLTFKDEEISLLGEVFGQVIQANGYWKPPAVVVRERGFALAAVRGRQVQQRLEQAGAFGLRDGAQVRLDRRTLACLSGGLEAVTEFLDPPPAKAIQNPGWGHKSLTGQARDSEADDP